MGHTLIHVLVGIVSDDLSFARHQVHQPLESGLYGIKVGINIGMVKFNRGQDDGLRKIVQKLWAFIKKSGVVLIAFNNEMLSLAQGKAAAKIFCNPADKKRRVLSGSLKN